MQKKKQNSDQEILYSDEVWLLGIVRLSLTPPKSAAISIMPFGLFFKGTGGLEIGRVDCVA